MSDNRGTPGNLVEAIENGRKKAALALYSDSSRVIAEHVIDFLAQHFGVAYLTYDGKPQALEALHDLWERIKTKTDWQVPDRQVRSPEEST